MIARRLAFIGEDFNNLFFCACSILKPLALLPVRLFFFCALFPHFMQTLFLADAGETLLTAADVNKPPQYPREKVSTCLARNGDVYLIEKLFFASLSCASTCAFSAAFTVVIHNNEIERIIL